MAKTVSKTSICKHCSEAIYQDDWVWKDYGEDSPHMCPVNRAKSKVHEPIDNMDADTRQKSLAFGRVTPEFHCLI